MRKTTLAALLSVATMSVLSLASGATYLEAPLPGGLPLGNALAAVSLCSVAGMAVGLSSPGTPLRAVALASLLAAAAWLPVSILLAGNVTLNFSGGRGAAWLAFSLATIAGALTSLLWALVASLLAKYRRAGAA